MISAQEGAEGGAWSCCEQAWEHRQLPRGCAEHRAVLQRAQLKELGEAQGGLLGK